MKKIHLFVTLLTFSFFLNSCESLELDGQENPNNIAIDKADPTLLLNSTQVSFADFFKEVSDDARPAIRMVGQFGTYANSADAQEVQTQWNVAYADILQNVKAIETISKTRSIPHHLAIAKILEAYTVVTLVDFYGDVPYSQALQGSSNLNPKVDSGSQLYDLMIVKLNESIALFSQPVGVVPINDFYYGTSINSSSNWIKLANTLKLKMYNNLRLTRDVSAEVNALVAGGNLMSSNADDFNFKYTTSDAPVDSRHGDFINNYFAGKNFYISNSYYNLILNDYGVTAPDPRRRFYFYKQTLAAPTGANLPCSTNPSIPICYVGLSYWGRDHADGTGIPNDNTTRTIVGLYPAGGKFDNNNNNGNINVATDKGLKGAGVLNILDYSFSRFILAELTLSEPGVLGTPASILTAGVTSNLSKVMSFGTSVQGTLAPTAAIAATYVTRVNTDYLLLTTNTARLDFIIKESFKAYWGNGLEPYNAYRRTGFPSWNPVKKLGMQPPVTSAGDFPRTFFYPKDAIDNNNNLVQKPFTTRVFWDNNPAGFIN